METAMHRLAREPRRPRPRRGASRAAAPLALALALAGAAGAAPDDRFLEGYAAAVVERDLGLRPVRLEVRGGRALVVVESLGDVSEDRVVSALTRVEGIDAVEVRTATPGGGDAEPGGGDAEPGGAEEPEPDGLEILPRAELFEPLLADPRQPRFSASYLWYLDDPELERVGAANFGEHFALLGGPLGGGRWELGLLAGVFSIFDLDAASYDLVNSDFLVGPTLSARGGRFSGQVRLYHQSSHLGDEFLLRNRTDRINLSYEGVDVLASVDLHPAIRVYAGGGAIVHSEPDLDPWSVQGGVEVDSPWTFLRGALRPVASGDFQFREENDWKAEISVRSGLQIENPRLSRLRLQVLFEYFQGNSPNGQFWGRSIEYMGVGAHLYF